jgi:NAD(P)-dependent dehydrogenase (short-subunit alcohol dehydrogenase family)
MTLGLLEARTVLVTGAGGRLGGRIALTLAHEGAAVVVADMNEAAAAAVATAVTSKGGTAVAVEMDVSDEQSIERGIAVGEAGTGEVDALVNCHGFVPNRPLLDMIVDEWDRTFAVNVRGTMLTTRACARQWVRRGTRGAVVNLSSIAAVSARAGGSHYCSSKAAVTMLTKVSATELGPFGIRVNAVAPGLVLDDVVDEPAADLPPYVAAMLEATPLGRTGSADEIADAVAFLLSERSRYTTGAVVDVTGGVHCGRTHMPLSGEL